MSKEFIPKITPEKRKIRELKYSLYSLGLEDNTKYIWASLIINRNDEKTILTGEEKLNIQESNINKNRIELLSIIEGLDWINGNTDKKYKKYINVTIYSSNIYCVNIIKEWLIKWKNDNSLDTRPNSDLLNKLFNIISNIKTKVLWASKENDNNMLFITNKLNKEEIST
jgi:ribonuclease HI